MCKRFAVFIVLLCLPAFAGAAELSGTASYRERIAMPPDAKFVAILYDISNNDQVEIGRYEAGGDTGPPYSFTIEYPNDAVSDTGRYAVQAQVRWPDRAFFAAGTILEEFPANRNPTIDLTMVRPQATPAGGSKTEHPKTGNPIGAHGLQLPATFKGQTETNGSTVDWHVSLWPDQTFQLKRTFREGAANTSSRSSIGRWHADPAKDALILRDGAEMPLMVRVAGRDTLEIIDANTGAVSKGALKADGTYAPADLDRILVGGMLVYFADAAMMEECLTGNQFPIAQDGDYLALERAYLADRPAPGEPLYVMFEGGLATREAMEGPPRQMLTVDRFIRTRPGISCERQMADAALINTFWRLDELDGKPVPNDASAREPHMVLSDEAAGDYRVMLGCNHMRGSMSVRDDSVEFSPKASTLMACPPPIGDLEQSFGTMLSEVSNYGIEGETLVLSDKNGRARAIFTAVYF